MICTCCGFEIQGQTHQIENGEKQVCDKCWNNPSFFFSEKAKTDTRFKLLSEIAVQNQNSPKTIEISVLKLSQKNIDLYIGKMKSKDILQLYEVDKFKDEELEGYQREQYEERTSELIEYLTECPIAVMPSLFVSLRNAKFVASKDDFGILRIPKVRGAIWIIDGQHRVGGFEKLYQKFTYQRKPNEISTETFATLMDYELPIVFIDTQKAAVKTNTLKMGKSEIMPEDLERAIFFVVNKTQKGISSSLKDALLYRLNVSGIDGIPALRKEKWRIQAAHVGISLNRELDSPLKGLINIGGKAGTRKPIQLNSFVSSLELLFNDKNFAKLEYNKQVQFLKFYWESLRKNVPQAFDLASWRDYMLLKAIGVYCVHWLALDVFNICLTNEQRFDEQETLDKIVSKMSDFDWKTQTSLLSTLGGLKGAKRGYEKIKLCLTT
ncbi:MAG: DGQHR domain-containing protein [Candidatus Bathyarchaeia archaeon]|jgi:DGQHR domain-containing protein